MGTEKAKNDVRRLIEILKDHKARIDERDDAAMDLSFHAGPLALQALAQFCIDNSSEDEILLSSCGESIAEIWLKLNMFDRKVLNALPLVAKREATSILKVRKPEWIEE